MASCLSADGMTQAAVPAAGARLDAYGNWANAECRQAVDAATSVAPVCSELPGFQEGGAKVYAARLPEHPAPTLADDLPGV